MRSSDWSSDVCSSDLAVVGCRPGLQLGDLLLAGRISILVQRQPRPVALDQRPLQRDLRIHTDGQALLATSVAVLHPPVLGAVRHHLQIEAAAGREPVRLRLRSRIARGPIRQCFTGYLGASLGGSGHDTPQTTEYAHNCGTTSPRMKKYWT